MAESSSHNPSSPEITPKEEPVTLDKPKSVNPFLPVDQIEFSFDEGTNNEVSTPTGGIRGDISITTFWNALRAHYLSHSSMYVPPPSITIVRPWFATIGYSGEIRAKGTLKKSCLPPTWWLLIGQIIQFLGGKIGGLDQISNKDATILYYLANRVKVDYTKLIWEDIIHKLNKKTQEKVVPYPRFISLLLKYMMPAYDNEELTTNPTQETTSGRSSAGRAPKNSHKREVPQCKKPGAKGGLQKKTSPPLKHTSESHTEASKSKTGQLEKDTQSSSAKDKSPSHPSPPTPMVGEMHKEAQQAAGGPTSLEATSEERAHPQLSSGMSAFKGCLIKNNDSVLNDLKALNGLKIE
ncbi:hypothetical protein Tco_0814978 [Tanacetum coccineum]